MKNKTVFIVLFFCFLLLTGCGGSPSSEKSTELSEKYDFYKAFALFKGIAAKAVKVKTTKEHYDLAAEFLKKCDTAGLFYE